MVPLVLYFAEFSSPEIHQEDFCRNILTDPEVVRICNNIFFWAIGNCPESLEIQRALLQGHQRAPVLVAITHDAFGRQMTPRTLTDCKTNRELREQQDREYQESLAQDQERERQRAEERQREEERQQGEAEGLREEERNRAEAERRNAEAIREAREGLPPEPLENENTLTVRIRGPNGNSVLRTFFNHETTQVLFRAAFALLSLPSQDFVIHRHQGPPIHNDGSSLVDLSLNNYTVLIIEMQDESGP
ncbi:FAS-associated factor2 [Porites harrisoni]